MGKNKEKTSLSAEEKELVHQMKRELQMMGVPRDQWAQYIQNEITSRRSNAQGVKASKKQGGVIGFFKKIWDKILGFFFKSAAKRFTNDEALIEEFQKYMEDPYQMSEEEQKIMQMFNPQVRFDDVDKLGMGGGSFKGEDEGEEIIVEFEDDDEDIDQDVE
jgi:hypothetical protein